MLLYIIRHGEPDPATGALTEKGWRQAEAVGKLICRSKIDKICKTVIAQISLKN